MASQASQPCLLKTKLSSLQVRPLNLPAQTTRTMSRHVLLSSVVALICSAASNICDAFAPLFSADFPDVISVHPSRRCRAATTRSWDFLDMNYQMPNDLLNKGRYGEDIIIGVVDTGIWPESRSFSDEGYGPVPSRWRGKCQVGQGWDRNNCSRKIIGARFYTAGLDEEELKKVDYLSPRDAEGHGTHTASTAAGSVVEGASFHGLAAGVARGGAPHARIAVYKALWRGDSTDAALLAAIDDAIHDGVDVLSLSIGGFTEYSFGALHAVQKGITVVYSGGNDGPRPQTVGNNAPWVITVAASKIDRSFPTVITLGNKQQIVVWDTNNKL